MAAGGLCFTPPGHQALAADRPTVLDFRTDPDIPPIPPHATFEQAKDAAKALLKGDPNRWGVLKEGLMAKAREVMPGNLPARPPPLKNV